jgi:GntR family transcriptional regulator
VTRHRRASSAAATPPDDDGARPRRRPRYLAIVDVLRAEIAAAAPNTILPNEQALARRFAVSRLTLRRALGLLERSGLVSRRPGRGTVVSPPKVTRLLAPLYTLEQDLRGQGIKLETRLLRHAPAVEPPADVREKLRLRARSKVAIVELLRLVDDQVIAHDLAYVPTAFAARFPPEHAGEHPLLDVLRDRDRVRLDRLDWELEILPSTPAVATALGITPGMLVVASRATAYADDGVPVSRSERCYRIDRVKFHVATRYAPDPSETGSRPTAEERKRRGEGA